MIFPPSLRRSRVYHHGPHQRRQRSGARLRKKSLSVALLRAHV